MLFNLINLQVHMAPRFIYRKLLLELNFKRCMFIGGRFQSRFQCNLDNSNDEININYVGFYYKITDYRIINIFFYNSFYDVIKKKKFLER